MRIERKKVGKMKEIKPCPFCGGKGGIMFGGVNSVWVNCQQCDADGPWVDTKGYESLCGFRAN